EHEPAVVAGDVLGQPVAVRLGTEEQEQPLGVAAPDPVRVTVVDVYPLQPAVTTRGGDLAAGGDLDARVPLDLVDEVPRHGLLEAAATHHDGHALGEPGQVDRGLAGRVAAADDHHVVPLHLAG